MESIYAALLLHKASKKITEANIEKVLKAVDVDVDKTQITKLIAGLKGKDIDEIIASAAAAPVMAAPIAATAGAPAKEKAPAKKEEEEEEEEEEPTGIGSLF
ncbi:MAG: 50S ribosomal protein L12 [Promethearchaeota archaeon]